MQIINEVTVRPTGNLELIRGIITEPKLFALSYGQSVDSKNFEVEHNGFHYLHIKNGIKTVGCMQVRTLTRILLEAHIYILPEYWGTGISDRASEVGFEWAKSQGYYQVFTDVPKECTHVIRLLKRVGWVQCGHIKDGIIFNNKLQDLKFFCYDLRG